MIIHAFVVYFLLDILTGMCYHVKCTYCGDIYLLCSTTQVGS